jgi:hypothetical protein
MKHVKDVNHMINFPLDSQEDILERLRETIMGNAVFNDLGIPYIEPEVKQEQKPVKRMLSGKVIAVNDEGFMLDSKLIPELVFIPLEDHKIAIGNKVRVTMNMVGDEIADVKVNKLGVER